MRRTWKKRRRLKAIRYDLALITFLFCMMSRKFLWVRNLGMSTICACVTKYLLNKIEWVWEWGVGVCIQFVFISQWKLLWMIFTSLINICSEKRNTTNDGNGTCTHVINAFYTFNMTFSNKMSWTKLNLVFTTAIFNKKLS